MSDCSGTVVDLINLIPGIPGIGLVWAEVYDRKQWPGFWHKRAEDGELHVQWLGVHLHIYSWAVLKNDWYTMNRLHRLGLVKRKDLPPQPKLRSILANKTQAEIAA
jgi:hypothetical protein